MEDTLQKKRIFNLRKPFICFIGLVIGIILSYHFFVSDLLNEAPLAGIILAVIFALILVCSTILFILYKRRGVLKVLLFHRVARSYICILIFTISMIVGVALAAIPLNDINSNVDNAISGRIEAKVENITEYDFGATLQLDDVVIYSEEGAVALPSKATVYISYLSDISIGSIISFEGKMESNKVYDTEDINKIISGYGYTINAESNISVVKTTSTLRSRILNHILAILSNNMSENNAILSYSMMFGDKNSIPEDIQENFSISGVLHLLAVSGLHVGIISGLIIGLLNLVFKKVGLGYNIKKIVIISLLALFLLFYAYLCAFAVSVCRASIMVLVYMLSKSFGLKYDTLNSLSVAGIIILLVNPLSVLGLGFQLSFLCIFAIITIAPMLTKFLTRLHIPKVLAMALATSICVNVLIFPVLINSFGEASLISVVSNIIVIPLFSFIFPIIFYTLILSLIFPFLSFVLAVPDVLVQILKVVIDLFASIPFGMIRSLKVGYLVLALLILFSFVAKYFMSNPGVRRGVIAGIFVLTIVVGAVSALPTNYDNTMLLQYKYSNLHSILVVDGKVVSFGLPASTTSDFVNDVRLSGVDVLVLYEFDFNEMSNIKDFVVAYGVKDVYYPDMLEEYEQKLSISGTSSHFVCDNFAIGDTTIKYVYNYSGDMLGMIWDNPAYKVLSLMPDLDAADYTFIGSEYSYDYDYIILHEDVDIHNYDITADNIIVTTSAEESDNLVLNKMDYCDINMRG